MLICMYSETMYGGIELEDGFPKNCKRLADGEESWAVQLEKELAALEQAKRNRTVDQLRDEQSKKLNELMKKFSPKESSERK
jgi:hypothetical protein